jgi:hypothetical protein
MAQAKVHQSSNKEEGKKQKSENQVFKGGFRPKTLL